MSIAAFFRTAMPCVQAYHWQVAGRDQVVYTDTVYINSNVQPMKQGFTLNISDNSLFYFTNYQTVYTKQVPLLPQPAPPTGATGPGRPGKFYFWYKKAWYVKTGDQDWTECGRNPKHYVWYGIASTDVPAVPDPLDPITVQELEKAVSKLHMVNIFKVTPINNYP